MVKIRICTLKKYPPGTKFKNKKVEWTSTFDSVHHKDIKTFSGSVQILNNGIVRIAVSKEVAEKVFKYKDKK